MTTTIETRHFAITDAEIRAAETDASTPILTGYAAVFDSASHDLGGFREFVAPGAFRRALEASTGGDQNANIFAFWSHDSSQPLGSIQGGKLKLTEDERGLRFELDTSRMTPAQLDAARDGELRMSFGFRVREQAWKTAQDGTDERTLLDVDLVEVSPVVSPVYSDTSAAIRSMTAWKIDEARDPKPSDEEVRAKAEAWEVKRLELLNRYAEERAKWCGQRAHFFAEEARKNRPR